MNTSTCAAAYLPRATPCFCTLCCRVCAYAAHMARHTTLSAALAVFKQGRKRINQVSEPKQIALVSRLCGQRLYECDAHTRTRTHNTQHKHTIHTHNTNTYTHAHAHTTHSTQQHARQEHEKQMEEGTYGDP